MEEAVNAEQCGYLGVQVLPDLDPPLEVSLPWAVDRIVEYIDKRIDVIADNPSPRSFYSEQEDCTGIC